MKVITKKNAKTKKEFASLIFAHKNNDFNSFMVFAEGILEQYANNVGRGKVEDLEGYIHSLDIKTDRKAIRTLRRMHIKWKTNELENKVKSYRLPV